MTFPSQINSIAAMPLHSGARGSCRVSWRVCRWRGRVDMINLSADLLCCGGCFAWGDSHLLNLGPYLRDNTGQNAFASFCSVRDSWESVSHLAMRKILWFQQNGASLGRSWSISHLSHPIKIILVCYILTTQVNVMDGKTSWLLALKLILQNNLKGIHFCTWKPKEKSV